MQTQYSQVIQEYRQRIFSFAYYSLHTKADAEDVTQEVFIRLWQHWQKIDHQCMGAWLMRVARNAVIDQLRKSQVAQKRIDENAEVELQADSSVNQDWGHNREQSREESKLHNQQIGQILQQAIAELDEPFRSIVIMRDIQGHSYEDLQQVLDLNKSQVKVYLHRARKKLRENSRLQNHYGLKKSRSADSATGAPEATKGELHHAK